jgi:hypothetical protein
MARLSAFPLVGLVLTAPTVVRADHPDHEFMDRVQLQLKKLDRVPFPIYSQVPNEGFVRLNGGKVYWGGGARVFVPPRWLKRTEVASRGGAREEFIEVRGWQSDQFLDPIKGMAFVNVGWSAVTADTEILRKGDYVVYDGKQFVKGSLRPPERVEPRDTDREKASDLLSEAFFSLNVKDYEAARSAFKAVVRDYPDTTSAERAVAVLGRIGESGPIKAAAPAAAVEDSDAAPASVFVKEDGQSDVEAAEYLLSLAQAHRGVGRPRQAEAVVRGLLDRYPDTKAAARGRVMLAGLAADRTGVSHGPAPANRP